MSNLISKKDKNRSSCITHCRKKISSKILLSKELTVLTVVLKAAEIWGDELCHKDIYYLI